MFPELEITIFKLEGLIEVNSGLVGVAHVRTGNCRIIVVKLYTLKVVSNDNQSPIHSAEQ